MKRFAPPADTLLAVVDSVLPLKSYGNRRGYNPDFLSPGSPLPLPGAGAHKSDLAPLLKEALSRGQDKTELKYTHFSVRLLKSRRMPLYSAVNIDGTKTKKVERTDVWRRDPRIDLKYQNHRDAFGRDQDGPFSRGHVTRREDPNWGDISTAKQADMDTFHVTNAVPQQQGFNAGIWLDLEDYILSNTDDANMRVSVLSGSIFKKSDPKFFGVQVPLSFYKIVAFLNGGTKKLTTIGYKRSQGTFVSAAGTRRFVFGDFDDTQVSVRSLAKDTGLDLRAWQKHDVMVEADARLTIRLHKKEDLFLA